jgi:hypothetical protein
MTASKVLEIFVVIRLRLERGGSVGRTAIGGDGPTNLKAWRSSRYVFEV